MENIENAATPTANHMNNQKKYGSYCLHQRECRQLSKTARQKGLKMTSFLYYYPNRPILIPPDPKNPLNPQPDYINSLEQSNKYIAEQKWNGDNILLYTSEMEFWNRKKEKHRYVPSEKVKEELQKFPKKSILNLELIHYRTKDIKDKLIVHCIMAWKGNLLNGKTWNDSRKILENQEFGNQVILSPVWKKGFWKLFQKTDGNTIEGIILKNPIGKLVFSTTPIKDVSWMLKIRKPCKKYSF